jgi:hypothetical protein
MRKVIQQSPSPEGCSFPISRPTEWKGKDNTETFKSIFEEAFTAVVLKKYDIMRINGTD